VALHDFRGRPVVLAFYVADWHPVATDQLAVYQALLPHFACLDAAVLGISADATWSHDAFARATGIGFPLLADDAPPGAVARAYGVYLPETGRSRRALFLIDPEGVVRWSATFPTCSTRAPMGCSRHWRRSDPRRPCRSCGSPASVRTAHGTRRTGDTVVAAAAGPLAWIDVALLGWFAFTALSVPPSSLTSATPRTSRS
jgi:peroxiredoxin